MRREAHTVRGGGRADRGSAPIEVVLATPVLILLLMLAVVGGRATSVQIEVDAAAGAAARAASLQRTETAAIAEAERAALTSLSERCGDAQVDIDADLAPGGRVTVTLTCSIDTAGLPFGVSTVTATAYSPVDTWRAGDKA